jgi:hypothetical protein
MPQPLYPQGEPLVPTWAPGPVWTFQRRQKPLAFAGNQTVVHPACSLVTIVTWLCWLLSFPVPLATAVRILDTYKGTQSLTKKSNETNLTWVACGGISFLSD